MGRAVASGEVERGILICGTGLGISLAANKVKGVRAAVCSEPFTAKMSRAHNNCNILAFGARVVGAELAKMIVETWLDTEFEGGRHQRRVDMLMDIETGMSKVWYECIHTLSMAFIFLFIQFFRMDLGELLCIAKETPMGKPWIYAWSNAPTVWFGSCQCTDYYVAGER